MGLENKNLSGLDINTLIEQVKTNLNTNSVFGADRVSKKLDEIDLNGLDKKSINEIGLVLKKMSGTNDFGRMMKYIGEINLIRSNYFASKRETKEESSSLSSYLSFDRIADKLRSTRNQVLISMASKLTGIDISNLSGEIKQKIHQNLEKISKAVDDSDFDIIPGLIGEINKLRNGIGVEKTKPEEKKRNGTEIVSKEIEDKEKKYSEMFGDRWEEMKRVWKIDQKEDYDTLDKLFVTLGEGFGFIFIDTLWDTVIVEGGLMVISNIGKSLAFLLKEDYNLFSWAINRNKREESGKGDIALLVILVYIHANIGLHGWRKFKDYVIVTQGQKYSKLSKTKKKTKVTNSEGKVEYKEEIVDKWAKRIFGDYYLNATPGVQPNIFSFGEGESAEQNEYVKRKRTIEILKSYFYDNPKVLNELKNIELGCLQANTITYWRRLWRLLGKDGISRHGIVKRVVMGSLTAEKFPLWAKSEKEVDVLYTIEELKRGHIDAIELLFTTNESHDSDGTKKIKVDTKLKTDFLKGLEGYIDNNPSFTPKERANIKVRLNKILNQITGDKIIDKKRLLEELFRIKEGYATKPEMLDKINEELNKTREGNFIQKLVGGTKDILLRKKSNLEKLRDIISEGNWNGTLEEFNKLLEKVKEANIFISRKNIENKKLDFGELDDFTKEMEENHKEIEERLKLYESKSISHLENYIRYILPNESETVIKEILEEFKKSKIAYTEVEFFSELQKIRDGFIPSYRLLQELEKIKDKVIEKVKKENKQKESRISKIIEKVKKENKQKESRISKIIEKVKKIEIDLSESTAKKQVLFSGAVIGDIKDDIIREVEKCTDGNYENAMKGLSAMLEGAPAEIRQTISSIISDIKSIKVLFGKAERIIESTSLKELFEIDKLLELSRQGKLLVKTESLENLKKGNLDKIDAQQYEFTQENKDTFIEELGINKDLHEYDYRKQIGNLEGLQAIEKALKVQFKTELDYLKVIYEIRGGENEIEAKLKEFAESLNKNDYTRGQARDILFEIFNGEEIDLNKIVAETTDHKREFDVKDKLKELLKTEFNLLEPKRKIEILEFIKANNLPEAELPEIIKNQLEEYRNVKKIAETIKVQVAELGRLITQINSIEEKKELFELKKEFDKYISEQKINRNSEDFKLLIEGFNNNYNNKLSEFEEKIRQQNENKQEEEKIKKVEETIEEINKKIKLLEEYRDRPKNSKEFSQTILDLQKRGFNISEFVTSSSENKNDPYEVGDKINKEIERLQGEKIQELISEFGSIDKIPLDIIEKDIYIKSYIEDTLKQIEGFVEFEAEIKKLEIKEKIELIRLNREVIEAKKGAKERYEKKLKEVKKIR